MANRGLIGIVACEAGKPFAEKVYNYLLEIIQKEQVEANVKLIEGKDIHFKSTDIKYILEESIRGRDIFVIQDVENSTLPYSVPENFWSLKSAIDACKRSDAHYVTAVTPVFPAARQDRSVQRESVDAALVAQELENLGTDRIITLDVHNEALICAFRRMKFENLHASKNIIDYIKNEMGTKNLVVLPPDLGAVKRANHYAKELKTPMGFVYKRRDYSKENVIEEIKVYGDFKRLKGKKLLIVDDMIDTGGTMLASAEEVKKKYEPSEIHLVCSLPLFNGNAIEKLTNAYKKGIINSVIGTDAVYHGGEGFLKANPWYKEVSVAKYFARVIFNINHY
ncbi:MAG: ribose-phosphate diphosphokinase, partial [Candidatus Woesearchaeota archaeon]|nr:ribose-phosphate diphosphokinase [Candidatus Woesearchaeota archaeon]